MALAFAGTAQAQFPKRADADRGELLYTTHCIECHTTQVHWRDNKLAKDWDGLKGQIRRWQSNLSLGWQDAEIADVARYLNGQFYHYPQTSDQVSLARR